MGNASLTQLPASPVRTPATPEQYNAIINALLGILVIRDPTTGIEVDGAYDIGDIANGRPRNVNITGDVIQNGNIIGVAVPVGAIIAWHKSMPGIPATLPNNFHECDGSVISNVLSPMNGQTLPNLNSTGEFLRGGTTSGVAQSDQVKSHNHTQNAHSHASGTLAGVLTNTYPGGGNTNIIGVGDYNGPALFASGSDHKLYEEAPFVTVSGTTASATATNNSSTAGSPDETRPVNMSVVWIMRIY
jgi:hypothetical protein